MPGRRACRLLRRGVFWPGVSIFVLIRLVLSPWPSFPVVRTLFLDREASLNNFFPPGPPSLKTSPPAWVVAMRLVDLLRCHLNPFLKAAGLSFFITSEFSDVLRRASCGLPSAGPFSPGLAPRSEHLGFRSDQVAVEVVVLLPEEETFPSTASERRVDGSRASPPLSDIRSSLAWECPP